MPVSSLLTVKTDDGENAGWRCGGGEGRGGGGRSTHSSTRLPGGLVCGYRVAAARRVLLSWAKRAAFVACENVALQHHCEARAERRMAACVGLETG